ncbi:serine/threonine-protein phosphatase 6 regulatory ankyrin repeat subunit B-like isoform X1 [Mytilus trossulus]|uniref:serine/threonine-protein phosphatase 6 regulatory ankyrin repeat subunit B-like isoform X1 n=2 Tax=Mytilus trossulus TaxID=6551 RepID=UPI003004E12D
MAASMSVANAAANGDLTYARQCVENGGKVNEYSRDGMTPLAVAAFWGYADIAEFLLEVGANINLCNKGTQWTPLHCAAFQGHGKVIMKLMDHNPEMTLKDSQGRTAIDFASALDSIWPFFAAAGCRRTMKSELIQMDIVKKVSQDDPSIAVIPRSDFAHFSRPGSAYVMRSQPMNGPSTDKYKIEAAQTGDVLAGTPDEMNQWDRRGNPSLSMWRS